MAPEQEAPGGEERHERRRPRRAAERPQRAAQAHGHGDVVGGAFRRELREEHRWTAQVTVKNLFDERYYLSGAGSNIALPAPPRTAQAGFRFDF